MEGDQSGKGLSMVGPQVLWSASFCVFLAPFWMRIEPPVGWTNSRKSSGERARAGHRWTPPCIPKMDPKIQSFFLPVLFVTNSIGW
eukprot:UN18723